MIRYPQSFITTLTKFCSDKCNFKCSYCFHRGHFVINKNLEFTKKYLNDYEFNIVFNGAGEPTLGLDIIDELLPYCKSKVTILTNGSFPDIVYKYLDKYPNVYFIETIGCNHKSKYIISDRVILRFLISADTDIDSLPVNLYSPNVQYQLLYDKSNVYKDSNLQKYVQKHPEFIPQLTDVTNIIYGFKGCHDLALSMDEIFCVSKNTEFLPWLCESKQLCYDYMHTSKACDLSNGLHVDLLQDYNNPDYIEKSKIMTNVYQEINSYNISNKETLNILIDLEPNIYNPVKYNKLFIDESDKYLKNIFKSDIINTISLNDIFKFNDNDLLKINFNINELFNIKIIGIKSNIIKLFSDPNKYNLLNKYQTQIFQYLLRRIT